MKILHVITDLDTGGAEKLMADLLPRMARRGHTLELCVFNGSPTPLLDRIREAGITVRSLGEKRDYYSLRHIPQLAGLARHYDIIHTHNTAPQLFGAIASICSRAKWFTTEHTTTSHHRVWWYRPIERWMFRRYSRVICISDAAKASMQDVAGKERPAVSVIPNGIDIDVFANAGPVDKASINNRQDSRVILMVGRYSYQKDQATIIRSMQELPADTELWLAGYGETQPQLEALTAALGLEDRVHLLGMRSDVPQLLKAADVVVQSSHIEGFGLAAVEAMAAGVPVVASDVEGLAQVVDGAGLLFDHGNHHHLASQINSILTDSALRDSLIEKGRGRAARYGIDRMTDAYLEAYDQQ